MTRITLLLSLVGVFFLSSCSDTVRSPDLPPAQLTGISDISCAPTTLGLGQTGQCTLTAQCQFLQVRPDGDLQSVDGPCPGDFQFVSSNPEVVAIDGDGEYVGLTEGMSTITGEVGGFVSPPQTITVGPACVLSLAIRPENARLVAGFNQTYQAALIDSNGGETDVAASSSFESANTAAADFVGATLQSNGDLAAAATFEVSVRNDSAGNLCSGVTSPLEDSTSVTVEPGIPIDDPEQALCIQTLAAGDEPFTGCRADTGACPTSPIELEPEDTRQLLVRARFQNGLECSVTDRVAFSTGDGGIAAVDAEGLLTGVAPGETNVSAALPLPAGGTLENSRAVNVVADLVYGANSLVISTRAFPGTATRNNATKFACVGPNNLVAGGLGGEAFRAGQRLYAMARPCVTADAGGCTDDNFENLPLEVDLTGNNFPAGTDRRVVWSAEPGRWNPNSRSCDPSGLDLADTTTLRVGNRPTDLFTPPLYTPVNDQRGVQVDLNNNVLPIGQQPAGLAYSEAMLALNYSCVTARYEGDDAVGEVVDGLTIVTLPLLDDQLLGVNAEFELCDLLSPVLNGELLGPVLLTVTDLLSELLAQLDSALPLDELLRALLGPGELDPGLSDLLAPLIDPLNELLLTPVVDPLLCEVSNVLGGLLGGLLGGGHDPKDCADLDDEGGGGGDDNPLCDVPLLGPILCGLLP